MPIHDTKISHKLKRCASYLRAITKNNNNPETFYNLIGGSKEEAKNNIEPVSILSPLLLEDKSIIDYSKAYTDIIDKYAHYGGMSHRIIIPNRIREIRHYAFKKESNQFNNFIFFHSGKFDFAENANVEGKEEYYISSDFRKSLPHSLYFANNPGLDEADTIFLYGTRSKNTYEELINLPEEEKTVHDKNIIFLVENFGISFENINSFTENESQTDWDVVGNSSSIGQMCPYDDYKDLIPRAPSLDVLDSNIENLHYLSEILGDRKGRSIYPKDLVEVQDPYGYSMTGGVFNLTTNNGYYLNGDIYESPQHFAKGDPYIFSSAWEEASYFYPDKNYPEAFIPGIDTVIWEEDLLTINQINNKLLEKNIDQQFVYKYLGRYNDEIIVLAKDPAMYPENLTGQEVVKNIKPRGFIEQVYLKKIDIKNIDIIGLQAFKDCKSLNEIHYDPFEQTSIYGGTFYGCTSLTSMDINPQITRIGGNAFTLCGRPYRTEIINGVYTTIYEDEGNLDLVIPKTITRMGDNVFAKTGQNAKIWLEGVPSLDGTTFEEFSGTVYLNTKDYVYSDSYIDQIRNATKDSLQLRCWNGIEKEDLGEFLR